MTGKRPYRRGLTGEDKALWKRVAGTTAPLPDRARNLQSGFADLLTEMDEMKPDLPPVIRKAVSTAPSLTELQPKQVEIQKPLLTHPIDEPVLRKLAKGRRKIDARIDLHGMTQDRARAALLDFLELCRAADHRIVLVITGKGNMGTGILKQRVPDWLDSAPCRALVNGFRTAHPAHGGEGALYVRLRKGRR